MFSFVIDVELVEYVIEELTIVEEFITKFLYKVTSIRVKVLV